MRRTGHISPSVSTTTPESVTNNYVMGVDLKTLASTLIFTPTHATLTRFYPVQAWVVCTAASGPISVASLSIGQNASSYNDILAITALTGLNTANQAICTPLTLVSVSVPVNTGIFVKVATGFVGTSQSATIGVRGFYL